MSEPHTQRGLTLATVVIIVSVIVIGAGIAFYFATSRQAPTTPETTTRQGSEPTSTKAPSLPRQKEVKEIHAQNIPGAANEFTFSAKIPEAWQAEAVSTIEAISLYDPAAAGENNLEKSQIFIRHFTGNDFLTLSTVTIHSRTPRTINDRPAVQYNIEKKASVAPFPSQPAWRSGRHIVTDIRVSDQNPSVFYVIAKRPDLADEIYENFLQSLKTTSENTSLIEPVAEFKERITKKPFGIYVTPDNSPVSPERFTGYHTGTDVEYADIAGDVTVDTIAPGVVRVARRAEGYGGVLVIEHEINKEKVVVVYGHLKPSSLPSVGARVAAGDTIGILGTGGTTETDGERKHLHFAVLTTIETDLRGYVPTKKELSAWRDPLELFS